MFKKISKSEAYLHSLSLQNKVTNLNQSKHIQATSNMNSIMEEVKRDFEYKNRQSNISAANVILTS
nr:hypothetical protein [Saprospiraceae bacterium]